MCVWGGGFPHLSAQGPRGGAGRGRGDAGKGEAERRPGVNGGDVGYLQQQRAAVTGLGVHRGHRACRGQQTRHGQAREETRRGGNGAAFASADACFSVAGNEISDKKKITGGGGHAHQGTNRSPIIEIDNKFTVFLLIKVTLF